MRRCDTCGGSIPETMYEYNLIFNRNSPYRPCDEEKANRLEEGRMVAAIEEEEKGKIKRRLDWGYTSGGGSSEYGKGEWEMINRGCTNLF